ncbi:MAG: peptidylprolyl isomerase [Candidatus Poseidoniaceae archaeon]|nr:peptidylprolyl isomerase [Candidatus Poseidoniaceae archaeon]
MQLVEDLNILDEFELIPPKTAMKKIVERLSADPGLSFLIEDPKSGKICGFIDSLLINKLEEQGKKPKKGNVQSKMLTNLLFIINKTPLARLTQILPEKQPDAVIVNNIEGDFVGFLSSNDFQEAMQKLGIEDKDEGGTESDAEKIDAPPKPSRGPPKSRKKMEVESHIQETESVPEPEIEGPTLIVEDIADDDLEDATDAFFSRVKGRSSGDIANVHGELADEAWGGAAEGTLETGSIMHPLGAGQTTIPEQGPMMTQILMKTSAGEIQLQMYDDKAPDTVANFLKLVDQGFYDGLHFHRVIEQFMLQGGCPNSRDPNNPEAGTGSPGWKIPCEQSALALSHDRPGLMSMANAGPNTGGSQFFLTTVECPWLDGNHAIFGEVVSGMDIVMAIEGCQKGAGDRPIQPQQIISVSRA